MKKLDLHQTRKEFLEFFKEKEHLIAQSYPLLPKNDKSLLLINAGMAPLKPYFLGTAEPPRKRMSTCQKCVRTPDIENVGKTDRHGTFFEMLGNFSFGDYFKKEAIRWAWEFMTERMEIPEEKLWVSVYEEDDEAFDIWSKLVGIPGEKIVRLGKEDNFWEHGLGPCGPCSEIYIDRGEKYGCGDESCKPGCDCDRYVEVWNLVFSQFDKDENGNYNLLPNPNIDTGMGLERMVAVLNDANNIFEIEPIKSILKEVEQISGTEYGTIDKNDIAIRVITDHIRAITFMVSDSIAPSNEGRGYVLRRLVRRAARYGKILGIKDNFLYKLTDVVISNWRNQYTELEEKKAQIKKIIRVEEEKFQETLELGLKIVSDYIEELKVEGKAELDGQRAFKLYDTYGFPLDLTMDILQEQGFTVDEEGFNEEMENQRNRARKARKDGNNQGWGEESKLSLSNDIKTEFKGYKELKLKTKILAIIRENKLVDNLDTGEEGIIVLEETPFYAESGGQIGDKGSLIGDSFTSEVYNTKKGQSNIILHFTKVLNGSIRTEDIVEAFIDTDNRTDIARNHSATHILHRALRDVLGEHVNQAGSLVTSDRLRFDFTHFEGLTKQELDKVEEIVNSKVLEGFKVAVEEKTMDEAKAMGATGLFEDKYGDIVRIVTMGDYSMELCGGTHVRNTSKIGLFKILSESGIASGIRRIEAVTGSTAYKNIKNMENQINEVAKLLKTNKHDVIDKVKLLNEETKKLEKEIGKMKSKLTSSKLDDLIKEVCNVEGINIIAKRVDGLDMNSLRQLGDQIKDKVGSVLVVLGTVKDDKVNFVATATKDLVSKGIHSGNIIREVAKMTGGGGGGRPDMAQAGGKDSTKVDKALSIVVELAKGQLKS